MSTDSSQMLMLVDGNVAHVLWEVGCPLLPYGVCGFWMVFDLALISYPIEMNSHAHLTSTAFYLNRLSEGNLQTPTIHDGMCKQDSSVSVLFETTMTD